MVAAALFSLLAIMQPVQTIPLWPNGAPGSESRKDEAETRPHPWSIANIQNPSLTIYKPLAEKANGAAILIAPGGGFRELVIDEEGTKPAKLFTDLGFVAVVLKYRLPNEPGSGLDINSVPGQDAFRAMRLLRSKASELGVDPKRIGMIGFSAGGVSLSLAAFGPGLGDANAPDPIDQLDERPNFAIFVYPGGNAIPDVIPATAPPAFAIVANDDGLTEAVLKLVRGYRAAKISIEAHILHSGGHGFNMGDRSKLASVNTWPQRLVDWLNDSGYSKKP